ncbi:SET domain-containing protein [Gilbertella persicaria]|uniref:SET domain-containing protein n=1 Tax=Gilbertella persicaria TaxID=101096 RepID=UPI00221FACF6|nr:SET domain-containing protein [Gilbertella persicaria]KAI8062760.1 SET domain-containing protein [Gilbertella persicaria]
MHHHRYVVTKSIDTVKRPQVRLKCQKSPIHAWGVYADQPIAAHTMVIEFVGEIVRQQVAEARERQRGIGSRYLFRVDEDTMLDATHKGNMARFINHCCTPNCSVKIMMVHQQKKVMIYANRDIEAGEEITYDYKLPSQTEKIPCRCTSKFCKGT